jgi:hypothetical protein
METHYYELTKQYYTLRGRGNKKQTYTPPRNGLC